jgi:hypothetical protein
VRPVEEVSDPLRQKLVGQLPIKQEGLLVKMGVPIDFAVEEEVKSLSPGELV